MKHKRIVCDLNDKATLNCNVGSRPRPHDIKKKKNANSSIILFIQMKRIFFHFLKCCLKVKVACNGVNSFVFDSSCGRTIISWKVYCIEDEKLTLQLLMEGLLKRSKL